MADPDIEGIWGGTTSRDRVRVRRAAEGELSAKQSRAAQRAQKIAALRRAGVDPEEIADRLGVCVETVYRAKRLLEQYEAVEVAA